LTFRGSPTLTEISFIVEFPSFLQIEHAFYRADGARRFVAVPMRAASVAIDGNGKGVNGATPSLASLASPPHEGEITRSFGPALLKCVKPVDTLWELRSGDKTRSKTPMFDDCVSRSLRMSRRSVRNRGLRCID